MLRSDPATGWESIVVQSAEWISPSAMQRIDWLKEWHDLSARLPGHIRERLRLGKRAQTRTLAGPRNHHHRDQDGKGPNSGGGAVEPRWTAERGSRAPTFDDQNVTTPAFLSRGLSGNATKVQVRLAAYKDMNLVGRPFDTASRITVMAVEVW